MAIGRSQMRKQVEGQLRGARDEKRKVRTYKGGGMKNGKTKNSQIRVFHSPDQAV